MKKTLESVIDKIRSNRLTDEAKVKQWVILPILSALGWDHFALEEIAPEYTVDEGKVDFALLIAKPLAKPLVFIEAKRLGNANTNGEEQLFNYANNKGVPFLILTDGAIWNFYLSMAEGIPADRQFFHADLRRDENIDKYADFFVRYFQKDAVISGRAKQEAEKMHETRTNENVARKTIPDTWRDLLKEPDEILRDLLVETVEGKCGTKPNLDDVEDFLQKQIYPTPVNPTPITNERPTSPNVLINHDSPNFPSSPRKKIVGFSYKGEHHQIGTGNGTMAAILKRLQQDDAEFLDRLEPRAIGKSRKLVAKKREDLYRNQSLLDLSQDMENGWWMMSCLSNTDVRNYTSIACEVAGVQFDSDLKLIERSNRVSGAKN